MKHYIKILHYTDRRPDGRINHIIWDDEAGTVTGDHYKVPSLQEKLSGPMPYIVGGETFECELQDIAHDPADFLVVLGFALMSLKPPEVQLPDSLKDIQPTKHTKYYECPPGSVQ